MENQSKTTLRINGFPNAVFLGTPGDVGEQGISYIFPRYNSNYKSENNKNYKIENSENSVTFGIPDDLIHENDYVICRNSSINATGIAKNRIEFRKIKIINGKKYVSESFDFSFPMLQK